MPPYLLSFPAGLRPGGLKFESIVARESLGGIRLPSRPTGCFSRNFCMCFSRCWNKVVFDEIKLALAGETPVRFLGGGFGVWNSGPDERVFLFCGEENS